MKAVVYTKYGPPEVLQIKEIEKPVPKENEILVKVHTTVVTSGDVRLRKADPIMVRTFNGFLKPKKQILGINFSGTVEETGKDIKEFKVGDELFGSTMFNFGAYAEYVCVSKKDIVTTKPSNLSFEESVAIPFGGLTALHFLRQGNIREGDKVLIYGASGSVGTAAVQLAKYFGAEVTGLCSSNNVELVKSLGADKVIDYSKEDFTKSGEFYDIIFDTVGKSPFGGCIKSLKENGYYLRAVHISPSSLIKGLWTKLTTKKKVVGGISIERKEDLIFLKELIESGKFKPVIDKTYSLEQIADAHRYVETGHKKGNVVITI